MIRSRHLLLLIPASLLTVALPLRAENPTPTPPTAPAASGTTLIGDPSRSAELPSKLTNAYANGARDITITPGTYVMPLSGSNAVILDGWKDVTVHAAGVTLIEEDVNQRPLQLKNCERVVFEGALLRFPKPGYTQGRIVAIRPDGKDYTVDWRIDKGYETPAQLGSLIVADQKTRLLRPEGPTLRSAKWETIDPGLIRFSGVAANAIESIQVGDWIIASLRGGGLVRSEECSECTFRNITIQNGGYASFFEDGGKSNHYLDCCFMPGPRPPGATEDQLCASSSDGFHSVGAVVGPHLERCSWQGLLNDDCIAVHGYFQTVAGSEGNRLYLETGHRIWFTVGDPIRISDKEGYFGEFTCTGLRQIKRKTEYREYRMMIRGAPQPMTITVRKGSQPEFTQGQKVSLTQGDGTISEFICKEARTTVREDEFIELSLDRECGAKAGALVSSPRHNGSGYRIINCRLGNTRSRGILVKGDDGLIEGNTISGCGMSAISIGPESICRESGYCRNITIRGNTLRGNIGNGSNAVILVHGEGAVGNGGIRIEGNVFEGNHGRLGILLEWTDGASISGNTFNLGDSTRAEALVGLADSRNIFFADNLISGAPSGLLPVKVGPRVEGVQGNDAAGFRAAGAVPGNRPRTEARPEAR